MCLSLPDSNDAECPHCGGPIDHDGTCLKGSICLENYRRQTPAEQTYTPQRFWHDVVGGDDSLPAKFLSQERRPWLT